jgi:hypothetical protein
VYQETLEDLSVVYFLKDLFTSVGINVNVVESFPETDLVLPTVSVDWSDFDGIPYELGNRKFLKERVWYIDVFAKTNTQRNDFTYKIFNALQDGVSVYDYNSGFPPDVTPDKLGVLIPTRIRVRKIPVDSNLVDEMYYRAVIIFTATYDKF